MLYVGSLSWTLSKTPLILPLWLVRDTGKPSTSVCWSLEVLHPTYKQWDQPCEQPEAALVEGKGKHSRRVNPAIRVLQQHSKALSLSCRGLAFHTTLTTVSRAEGTLRSIIPCSLSAELPPQLQLSPACPCKGCPNRNQSLADSQQRMRCDEEHLHHLSLTLLQQLGETAPAQAHWVHVSSVFINNQGHCKSAGPILGVDYCI